MFFGGTKSIENIQSLNFKNIFNIHLLIRPALGLLLCSRKGEDFLTGQPDFFTETAVTPERKVEKLFPRWEINRHGEG